MGAYENFSRAFRQKILILVNTVHIWGNLYLCFRLLVTSHLGFKARVGSLIHCFW